MAERYRTMHGEETVICESCGSVVVDIIVHDREHDQRRELEAKVARLLPLIGQPAGDGS